MLISALVVALGVAASSPSAVCARGVSRSVRPTNALALTLRATPESLPDHRRAPPTAKTGLRPSLRWNTSTVYGQVFELVRVDGKRGAALLRGHRRVVLIWWRDDAGCNLAPPNPAVRPDAGDLFMLARLRALGARHESSWEAQVADLRREDGWIRGMPTFDVSRGAWTYSPSERRPINLPPTVQGVLTIEEYRDFFSHLQVAASTHEEMKASWRRLLNWAEADPRRWTLYPANGELCVAVANLEARAAWRHRCPP
jgi:hypothetical protein